MPCVLFKDKLPDPTVRLLVRKLPLRRENTKKNIRIENGIMPSFRWISWHRFSRLRHRSLERGRLPSFPCLTWLSLPFQLFSFIVVFATYSCSFGAGIYAFSLYRNLNDFKGIFLWTGGRKRTGGLEAAGPENKGGSIPASMYEGDSLRNSVVKFRLHHIFPVNVFSSTAWVNATVRSAWHSQTLFRIPHPAKEWNEANETHAI